MKFYTVYLYCQALNQGKYSVVEATGQLKAIHTALSMHPGYELWDVVDGVPTQDQKLVAA